MWGDRDRGSQLFVSIQEAIEADETMMLMSISSGGRLTEAAIDAGAEHQIWYAGKPAAEDPDEARFVREYMTREMLEGMVSIYATDLLFFPKAQLEQHVNEYLDNKIEQALCRRSDSC